MIRKDREITEYSEIVEIVNQCDIVNLGLNGDDGYPYVVPMNFGIIEKDGKLSLLFHGARVGHKLELIKADPRAFFEMNTAVALTYDEEKGKCSYMFRSVMGKGTIRFLDEEEKLDAMKQLMDHYHPGEDKYFNPAPLKAVVAYVLDVEEMTGKDSRRNNFRR